LKHVHPTAGQNHDTEDLRPLAALLHAGQLHCRAPAHLDCKLLRGESWLILLIVLDLVTARKD
jgi:hypothetical protein